MRKIALFVYNGDPMCFIHVLLNALNMKEKGWEAKIVIEGAAVTLIPELAGPDHPLHTPWEKAKSVGLVEGVCKACSNKLGTLKEAERQGLALLDDMSGHPSMAAYRRKGFEIITF